MTRALLCWTRLALPALALAACGSRALDTRDGGSDGGTPDARIVTGGDWGIAPNRMVDLLFMIDNSSEMEIGQRSLVDSLPAFMNVLKGLPEGLPNLHIAVVTSDMGAGDGSITGCVGNGQNGVFQFAPRATCMDTTLQNGATFIADTGGANPQTNFTAPDITTVLQCIIPVGSSGCGFEHQLASVARALGADGQAAPDQNQGFLRPGALLVIILLSNEDDCSAPANSLVYDTSTNLTLASPMGPPSNFRCNEFGHLCGNPLQKPPRLSPTPDDPTSEVALGGCVSAEDQGLLMPVATFAGEIKLLKADPAFQIKVLSIQGPALPYRIHWSQAPVPDIGPWPEVEHSCVNGATAEFADPGVRLQQFVHQIGDDGMTASVCETSLAPTLEAFAAKLGAILTPRPGG